MFLSQHDFDMMWRFGRARRWAYRRNWKHKTRFTEFSQKKIFVPINFVFLILFKRESPNRATNAGVCMTGA